MHLNPSRKTVTGRSAILMAVLAGLLFSLLASSFFITSEHFDSIDLAVMQLVLITSSIVVLFLLWRSRREDLDPLLVLRRWVAHMPVPSRGELTAIIEDVGTLITHYRSNAGQAPEEIEQRLHELTKKTRSLEIHYDIATSIGASRDLDDLLTRFLHMLAEIANAPAATVRIMSKTGGMRLVASLGIDETDLETELPLEVCVGPKALGDTSGVVTKAARYCRDFRASANEGSACIIVPLANQANIYGLYVLLVDQAALAHRRDIGELLANVGYHLGIAVKRTHLDEEAQRLTISRERTMLAHELHDSLAQTLASLRFQVHGMAEGVSKGEIELIDNDLTRLRKGIDTAHTELRELLAHFRAPLDERGLSTALNELLAQFSQESGIKVFSQGECATPALSETVQREVLRILQEALRNVQKHSHARTVRLLIRCDDADVYHILLEDDGTGFSDVNTSAASTGEKVGMVTMQERAKRIGATLSIDSEQGEGTRIELTIQPTPNPINAAVK